jgi:hypothetical protein
MRRNALFLFTVICVCLLLGSTAPSGQRLASAALTRTATPVTSDLVIGPGYGGQYRCGSPAPVQFVGITTHRFPVGVGALAAGRVCNEEHPVSRLCEMADIFRALPPIALDSEVLVARNYDANPATVCLNPNGALRCLQSPTMKPAACCGYLPPPPASPASITLTPSDPQTVNACTDSFDFTATALDADGQPMAGIPLVFEVPPVVGGTTLLNGVFNPTSGLSDENGQVSTTLTFFESSCAFNCSGGKNCSTSIAAHDLGRLVFSNPVNLVDAIP